MSFKTKKAIFRFMIIFIAVLCGIFISNIIALRISATIGIIMLAFELFPEYKK